MKKILIALVVVAALLISLIFIFSSSTPDLYKDAKESAVNETFEKGDAVFYFYQESCSYCQTVKGEMTKLANDLEGTDTSFYLVDMAKESNGSAWYDSAKYNAIFGEGHDPKTNPDHNYKAEQIITSDDIDLVGTPAVMYVKDGKTVGYGVGPDLFDVLNMSVKDVGKDITYDASVYGKQ